MTSRFVIEFGLNESDRSETIDLLREYEAGLGISLCFQDFEAEIANLPGDYAPPRGRMLLLRDTATNALAGCVALRPVPGDPRACEMKRLYLRSLARGSGIGRRLALALMHEARRMGYSRMCLDTLPTMHQAQALYRSLGFRQTGTAESEPPVLLFEKDLEEF